MITVDHGGAAVVATIFFVNLRMLLLSAALSPYFRQLTPLKNMLIGFLLTDETFGVASGITQGRTAISEKWMHGLNVTAYLNWFVANLVGAVFGQWISNPEALGLDFALPGMFIGLLVLQLASRKQLRTDLIVAVATGAAVVGLSFFAGSSIGIIAATIVGSTLGMVIDKWK